MILVLDTATENVFIGLWDEKKSIWYSQESFIGGRELNFLIIKKLDNSFLFSQENQNKLTAIIVAAGPGSFTGLRIGMSAANTLAYTTDIPIVAVKGKNEPEILLKKGQNMLESTGLSYSVPAVPNYGAKPHTTKPKSH